jgi:hypothetical protein
MIFFVIHHVIVDGDTFIHATSLVLTMDKLVSFVVGVGISLLL